MAGEFLCRAGLLSVGYGATTFIGSLTGSAGLLTTAGRDIFIKVPATSPDTGQQVRFRFVSADHKVHDRFSIPFLKQGKEKQIL